MNIQTNNNSKNAASSACAACKHQRKRCRPDCALARYFPASNPQQFKDVHRLFRVSNVTKILDSVPSACERDRAMQSIIFEAGARRRDPVHGVVGILRALFDRVEAKQMELESLRRQIAFQKCFRIQRAQAHQTQMGMFTNVGFHMPKPNSRVKDMDVKPFNTAVSANGGIMDFKNEISGGIDCKDFKRSRIIAQKISYI